MKLLVAAGVSHDGYTTEVEIIDLVDPKNRCWNFQPFPVETERLIGSVIGPQDLDFPILCGMLNRLKK